jgi:hypothetical protein
MSAFRLAILAVLVTATLAACGRDEGTEVSSGASNALLDHIPSDTPYFAANLEPLPADVIDFYLARMQPALDEMQKQLSAARTELAGEPGSDASTRLALAVLTELDGNLSRSGLASLGLDILAPKVAYGLGAFPVVRLSLTDPEVLRATIERVLDGAAIVAPEQTWGGTAFWRIVADDASGPQLGLYLSILDDHLAVAVLPPFAEAELLPAFLGQERPAASDARARLVELTRARGFTPYGAGILDVHRLADEFLEPGAVLARLMAESGEYEAASVSAACSSEIHEIIDNAPRMTAGMTELSTSAVAYQYRLESPATLAAELTKLVAMLPAAEALSERVLELSFGMRLGAVRDFLREKASAIVADPYECEYLQEINSSAEQSLAQLDQPMPPFVNNFRGIRVSLSEIMMSSDEIPANARGHLALHVEQPQMVVGMAQMFLPDLSELALTPGGDPVPIPGSLIPMPDVVAFAAMSGDAIGLSLGEGEESSLPDFLARDPGPEGMFLSASYDTATYLEYTAAASHASHDANDGNPLPGLHAIGGAARSAWAKTADRSLTTMKFGPEGLVIDGRMTFKP